MCLKKKYYKTVSRFLTVGGISGQTYEEDGDHGAEDSGTSEVPDEVGVSDDGGQGEVDDVGETGVEEVDGGDQTSHVHGCAGVSDTVG